MPFPISMEEERLRVHRNFKKLISALLIGVLLFGKLLNLCVVRFDDTHLDSYLSISGLMFISPMYYITATVKCYNLFRVCACGAMLTEAAQFFLYLGVFRKGSWVIVEIVYICMLCFLLTTIEELFEQDRLTENIPLAEVTVTPRYTNETRTSEIEETSDDSSYWRLAFGRFRSSFY